MTALFPTALLATTMICALLIPVPGDATPIRVGVSAFALPHQRDEFLDSTNETLASTFGRENLVVTHYSVAGLERAVRAGEVDVFVSSAGVARRLVDTGARPLATSIAPGLEDPNHNEGTAVVLRHNDERTLLELRGTRLAANLPYGFSGYQIALGEIAAAGEDPDRFFAEYLFFHRSASMKEVAEAVASGRVDAGFLRLCAFEELEKRTPELARQLRVLPPPEDATGTVACRHSTRLYPAQGISVMPTIAPEHSRKLLVALLTMPPTEDGRAWSVATDYHAVDNLLKSLKTGPYAYLREWTVRRFIETYRALIALTLLALAGFFLHAWRSDKLVRQREAELEEAHRRETNQNRRIDSLQRAGAVGQLSSLIAHEVHQPLAAVRLYAEGLARQADSEATTPERIRSIARRISTQAERAANIVDRVRDYARERNPVLTPLTIGELLDHLFLSYPRWKERITLECPENLKVARIRASLIEMELAVVNLLRNAAQATEGVSSPVILLRVGLTDNSITFDVVDNGPFADVERIKTLTTPVTSEKPSGLGLGLSIVRHLIERHGGTLSFSINPTEAHGLQARIAIPLIREEQPTDAP